MPQSRLRLTPTAVFIVSCCAPLFGADFPDAPQGASFTVPMSQYAEPSLPAAGKAAGSEVAPSGAFPDIAATYHGAEQENGAEVAPASFDAPTSIPSKTPEEHDHQVPSPSNEIPLGSTEEVASSSGAAAKSPLSMKLRRDESSATDTIERPSGVGPYVTVVGSLALCLTLFLAVAWLLRRGLPKSMGALPSEVAQVMGRMPLAKGQHASLLRVGNKLVLVSLSGGGADTLTEITDPIEVDRLMGLCSASAPTSFSKSFQKTLSQYTADAPASESEA